MEEGKLISLSCADPEKQDVCLMSIRMSYMIKDETHSYSECV